MEHPPTSETTSPAGKCRSHAGDKRSAEPLVGTPDPASSADPQRAGDYGILGAYGIMVRGDYYWRAGFAPLRWVSLVVGFGLAAGVGYENYLNRGSHFGLYFLTVRSLLALVLAAAALCGVRRPLLAGFLYFVAGGFVLLSGAFFGSGMVAVAALVAVLLAILIVAGASRPASRAGTSTANHTVERS